MKFDTICVIGLGYIGLPTATMFASRRKRVIGVDINERTVATINQGKIHIVEPDLDIAVHAAVTEGYLRASTRPEPADAFLVAVPTPFKKEQKDTKIPTPDISYIQAAAQAIAPVLSKGNLIILESTSPVGATEKMAEWLAAARPDLTFPQQSGEDSDIRIAHCPERVLPGRVMQELIENDRIIGGMTPKCSTAACILYETFVRGMCLKTNTRTAEMAKLTENAFRDVNIAFANELSIICEEIDISVWELISLANRHPRVNILQPGPGVGGHCIAVDPWFIVSETPSLARLIHAARDINDGKPAWVVSKVNSAIEKFSEAGYEKPVIAFYGITFKPDIDDLRESPALGIIGKIDKSKVKAVMIVEPNVQVLPEELTETNLVNFETARHGADIHVMLVDHSQFKGTNAPEGVIIDTRGVWR